MILNRHKQRIYKKLFFSMDSVEFNVQLAPFVKKKIVMPDSKIKYL